MSQFITYEISTPDSRIIPRTNDTSNHTNEIPVASEQSASSHNGRLTQFGHIITKHSQKCDIFRFACGKNANTHDLSFEYAYEEIDQSNAARMIAVLVMRERLHRTNCLLASGNARRILLLKQ